MTKIDAAISSFAQTVPASNVGESVAGRSLPINVGASTSSDTPVHDLAISIGTGEQRRDLAEDVPSRALPVDNGSAHRSLLLPSAENGSHVLASTGDWLGWFRARSMSAVQAVADSVSTPTLVAGATAFGSAAFFGLSIWPAVAVAAASAGVCALIRSPDFEPDLESAPLTFDALDRQIVTLECDIRTELKKLGLQLSVIGGPDDNAVPIPSSDGELDALRLSHGDNLTRWYTVAESFFRSYLYATAGNLDASIPTSSLRTLFSDSQSIFGSSIGEGASFLTYIVQRRALRNLPDLAWLRVNIKLVENAQARILPKLARLDGLRNEARRGLRKQQSMVCIAHDVEIELKVLTDQMSAIDTELCARRTSVNDTSATAGAGIRRQGILERAARWKDAVVRWFASMGSKVTAIANYIGSALSCRSDSHAERVTVARARAAESADALNASRMWRSLSVRAHASVLDQVSDARVFSAHFATRCFSVDPDRVTHQLSQGENIFRTLMGESSSSYGVCKFVDRYDGTPYVLHSNLPSARALASFLYVAAAERLQGSLAPAAAFDEAGAVRIPDPERKLFNFLTCGSSAMPLIVAGLIRRDPLMPRETSSPVGVVGVDDPARWLPAASRCMYFHAETDGDKQFLRLAFDSQALAPIFNTPDALRRAARSIRARHIQQAARVPAMDFSLLRTADLESSRLRVIERINKLGGYGRELNTHVRAMENSVAPLNA